MTPEEKAEYQRKYIAANREKINARRRTYYQANKERILEQNREWVERNRDAVAETQRQGYLANREERLAYAVARAKADPEKRREYVRNWYHSDKQASAQRQAVYRNKRRAAMTGDLSTKEWQDILEEFDHRCAYCQVQGQTLTMEHMTPVSRGGRHDRNNVVPACKSCNSSKKDKTIFEFASIVPIKLRV